MPLKQPDHRTHQGMPLNQRACMCILTPGRKPCLPAKTGSFLAGVCWRAYTTTHLCAHLDGATLNGQQLEFLKQLRLAAPPLFDLQRFARRGRSEEQQRDGRGALAHTWRRSSSSGCRLTSLNNSSCRTARSDPPLRTCGAPMRCTTEARRIAGKGVKKASVREEERAGRAKDGKPGHARTSGEQGVKVPGCVRAARGGGGTARGSRGIQQGRLHF